MFRSQARAPAASEAPTSRSLDPPSPKQPHAAPQPASTSSSPSLADFQKPTHVVATLDTFIFTTEYQIAGG